MIRVFQVIFSSIAGIVSGALGLLGALGLCCTVAVAGFLALFGISSTGFLMTYNKLFILAAIIFFILAIIFFIQRRKKKCCESRDLKL